MCLFMIFSRNPSYPCCWILYTPKIHPCWCKIRFMIWQCWCRLLSEYIYGMLDVQGKWNLFARCGGTMRGDENVKSKQDYIEINLIYLSCGVGRLYGEMRGMCQNVMHFKLTSNWIIMWKLHKQWLNVLWLNK